jgi:hypothetical protein
VFSSSLLHSFCDVLNLGVCYGFWQAKKSPEPGKKRKLEAVDKEAAQGLGLVVLGQVSQAAAGTVVETCLHGGKDATPAMWELLRLLVGAKAVSVREHPRLLEDLLEGDRLATVKEVGWGAQEVGCL